MDLDWEFQRTLNTCATALIYVDKGIFAKEFLLEDVLFLRFWRARCEKTKKIGMIQFQR